MRFAVLLFAGVSAVAAPALGATPATVPPRTIKVTAAQLLEVANQALARGEDKIAEGAYGALLNDPSQDVRLEARFRLAMIEGKRGNLSKAAVLLREVVDARPDASRARLELAGLLNRMGDTDGAWRQLRAAQAAGLPPAVARIVDRYSEALRAKRPAGFSFEIAMAPDSNINHATRSDTLGTVLGNFQIADDAKAKSGTGLSLHSQAYRRFGLGSDASVLVRFSGSADLYRQKEFNDVAADVAIGPELTSGRSRLQLELGATQRWFGQKPFVRSARIAGTFSQPLGRRTVARLSASAALIDNQRNDLEDGKALYGALSLERALSETVGLALTGSVSRQSLSDPGYSTTGWRLGLLGWKDLGRTTLTLSGEIGRLHADERLLLFPDKRRERYSRLSIGATFRGLQLRGFAPVARFSIERNRSSIAFYDYRRMRTELGVVRAF